MSNNAENLKRLVKEKYGEIANQSKEVNQSSCCGTGGCCSSTDYTIFSENYTSLSGYNPDADLGLGCGIPTEFANIRKGDTVVDLGSGAGNDCFVARAIVGEEGKVIGIDFTETMIAKAKTNAEKLGFKNVQFRMGDIENMPLGGEIADVVVSNCVLNLVPDKRKAFSEIFRILKPNGHLSVSDVVITGSLPDKIKEAGEMYAGCVSGAIDKNEYLKIIKDAGFVDVEIKKDKLIDIPEEILLKYISQEELKQLKESKTGIYSITVYAAKPLCGCGCKSGCC
ncbi:MAG: arsenite S-adenosylmethyltransferase [Bacteroidetes bacterium GWE2_29_8]|nr:MAG: arsenite S-adenosylmethyltransferase [Bacteroidetes bacterium GWE2_29_8]OFY24971.1 MAG: arsenite S-adenosylmethyltransferase [Bacteroidetes bacterium GWF2_29_10]